MSEQNSTRDVKQMWHQKNKVWALIDKMVPSGFSAEVAINKIEQVNDSDVSITDVSQFSVRYKYLLWARPAKARR
jgi:hypothetical protein